MWCQKVSCDYVRSFILNSLGLMTLKTNYVRGITGMPKLRQTLKYNSDDILYYSEPFALLLGIKFVKYKNLILNFFWLNWCVN